MILLDPHDELVKLAVELHEEGDDADDMYIKLMVALRSEKYQKLRLEVATEYFYENKEKEPWVRGKKGEPELEGGSIEEVARKTGLDLKKVEKKTVDFLDKNLGYKDLPRYWQKKFLEEVVEEVANNVT